jgi:glycosyltransferase involved in cell wall biosynthesis
LKVAVDARMLPKSGIGMCIHHFLLNNCYDIALGKPSELESYSKHISEIIPFDCSIYGYKEQIHFPYSKLKRAKPDVLHIPHCNIPLFYRGKMIVTIHDLTHLIYPEFLPFKLVHWYFKFIFWFVCKRADHIMTDSENTRKDLIRFCNANPDKISVVPLGVSREFVIKKKESIQYLYSRYSIPRDKKLILYVGNLLPHKNLETLMEAFAKMRNKQNCRLILVGKAFENYKGMDQEKKLGIEHYTIHTGMVSQDVLVDLYNLADLFVLPSLYEGFGLPILEALACGTPVACSNTSSLPEVGGSIVTYFDPMNRDDITKVLELGLTKKGTQNRETQEWVSRFSWERTSANISAIAERVVHSSQL